MVIFFINGIFFLLFEIILPLDSDILDYIFFYEQNDHPIKEILERLGYQMIGYSLLIFGALILNEIVVLNFLGFNKNISERSANDSLAELNINSENNGVNEGIINNQESEDN